MGHYKSLKIPESDCRSHIHYPAIKSNEKLVELKHGNLQMSRLERT